MKASNKDILREIRKSGMRFFYISAIIALGVAFFCGIKATSPSMVKTAVEYFSNYDLSDFRLLSTYGFREKDIQTLAGVNGVEEAVGGYSIDVVMNINDSKDVIKIISLPDPNTLNQPILLEGRFPEELNECVIESTDAHVKNTQIGQTIEVLNESHTEEELNHLKSRQFTIVGYVQSPQYISIERGNTNIGNGTIDGYMLVPKTAFDYDRFTEAYVYTDVSAQGIHPYSEEYSEAQDQMISSLEKAGDQILDDNIFDIRMTALREIGKAQTELDDKKKEFDTQIADAQEQINSGQRQIDQGYVDYENGVNEFNTQIASAESEIISGQNEIDEGYQEYYSGRELFANSIAAAQQQLADARTQLDDGYIQYEVGRQQMASLILNGQNELLAGREQLNQGYLSYNQGLTELNTKIQQAQLELAAGEQEINEGYASYNSGLQSLNSQINQATLQLNQARAQLDEGYKEYQVNYDEFNSQMSQAQGQLDEGWSEYNTGLNEYNTAVNEYETQIQAAQTQIDQSAQQIDEAEKGLEQAQVEYDQGTIEYEKGLQEYNASLPEAEAKIEEARAGLNQIVAAIEELKTHLDPLQKAFDDLQAGINEVNGKIAEVNKAISSNTESTQAFQAQLEQINKDLEQAPDNQELLDKKTQIESALENLKKALEQVQAQMPPLQEQLGQLTAQMQELEPNLRPLQQQNEELNAQKASVEKSIQDGLDQIEQGKAQLDEAKQKLDQAKIDIANGWEQLATSKEQLEAGKEELAQQKEQGLVKLEEAKAVLESSFSQLSQAQQTLDEKRNEAQTQLDQALQILKDGEEELNKGQQELEAQRVSGEKQLNEALKTLMAGAEQITKGRQELETQKAQGENRLNEAYALLVASEEQLTAGQAELEAARNEGELQLSAGLTELQQAEVQLNQGETQLNEQRTENEEKLEEAQAQLIQGQEQLDQGRAELAIQRLNGQNQLTEGLNRLRDSQNQLLTAQKEFDTQRTDGERQIKEAQEQINTHRREVNDLDRGKWYVYSREDNPGYTGYKEDAERIDNVGNVFPLFFFLVAALVAFTTMTRMVEEERTQIGTLYALGYSRGQIIKKYVVYAGTAALIGCTFGWIAGIFILPQLIFTAYNILYQMPDLVLDIPWHIVVISYIVALFCTVGAAVLIALSELRSVPAELMRPKAPKPGKRIFLEHIPFIWNKLSFISKISLRNIFRYKARFFMTVIGIAGCTALILAGFGLHDAIFAIVPNQFGNIFKYDQSLIIKDADTDVGPKLAKVLADERVSDAMPADQQTITVATDQGTLNAYLIVPKDPKNIDKFVGLHERTNPGVRIDLNDEGVIVSEKLATNYGASPGNTVKLDINNERYEVKVSAETENYLQNYVYMTPALYQKITGEPPKYSVIFVNFSDQLTAEEDQQQFAADMIEKGDYSSAINVSTMVETSTKTMESLNVLVIVMIVSAGMLAFIVLNNLTNINISERIREIATLKVLGFRNSETNNYIFRENIVLSLFGIAVGLVLGVILLKFIIFTVELDIIMFGREIKTLSYIYAILLTLGFTIIVNFTMIPVMRRVNMVEALKDID